MEPALPEGYVRGRPATQVTMTLGTARTIDFVLREDNRISGRIVGPDGQPLQEVRLELLPATGTVSRYFRVNAYSGADGTFKIEGFPSGEYLLIANRDGVISGRVPFGAAYYPGTTSREEAHTVTIAAGQHLENLTLRVPKLLPTITVTGSVRFGDGVPAPGAYIHRAESAGHLSLYVKTDDQGRFTVPLLAGQPTTILAEWSVLKRETLEACPEFRGTGSNSFS